MPELPRVEWSDFTNPSTTAWGSIASLRAIDGRGKDTELRVATTLGQRKEVSSSDKMRFEEEIERLFSLHEAHIPAPKALGRGETELENPIVDPRSNPYTIYRGLPFYAREWTNRAPSLTKETLQKYGDSLIDGAIQLGVQIENLGLSYFGGFRQLGNKCMVIPEGVREFTEEQHKEDLYDILWQFKFSYLPLFLKDIDDTSVIHPPILREAVEAIKSSKIRSFADLRKYVLAYVQELAESMELSKDPTTGLYRPKSEIPQRGQETFGLTGHNDGEDARKRMQSQVTDPTLRPTLDSLGVAQELEKETNAALQRKPGKLRITPSNEDIILRYLNIHSPEGPQFYYDRIWERYQKGNEVFRTELEVLEQFVFEESPTREGERQPERQIAAEQPVTTPSGDRMTEDVLRILRYDIWNDVKRSHDAYKEGKTEWSEDCALRNIKGTLDGFGYNVRENFTPAEIQVIEREVEKTVQSFYGVDNEYTPLQRKHRRIKINERKKNELLAVLNDLSADLDLVPLVSHFGLYGLDKTLVGGEDAFTTGSREIQNASYDRVWEVYNSLPVRIQKQFHPYLERVDRLVSSGLFESLDRALESIRKYKPLQLVRGHSIGKYNPIRLAIRHPALAAGAAGVAFSEIFYPGLPTLYRAGVDLMFGSASYFLASVPISVISFYKEMKKLKMKASIEPYSNRREVLADIFKSMVRSGVVKTFASCALGLTVSSLIQASYNGERNSDTQQPRQTVTSPAPEHAPSTQTPVQGIIPIHGKYFGDEFTARSGSSLRKGARCTVDEIGYDFSANPTLILGCDGSKIVIGYNAGGWEQFSQVYQKLNGRQIELTRDPFGTYGDGQIYSPDTVKVGHQTLLEFLK